MAVKPTARNTEPNGEMLKVALAADERERAEWMKLAQSSCETSLKRNLTPNELAQLETLLAQGYTADAAAAKLCAGEASPNTEEPEPSAKGPTR